MEESVSVTGRALLRAGLLALALAAVTSARPARADDAACFATSENELTLRKHGKLLEARRQLAMCASPPCPEEVRAECSRRLIQLNAVLPTIVLRATDAAGNDLSGVTVTVDGAAVPDGLTGRAIPVDPGNHTLRFAAPGKPAVDKVVLVTEGERDRRIVVAVGAAATTVASPPPAETSTGRLAGYVVGGAGVLGIVVGSVVGGLAIAKSSSAKGECNGAGGSCATNSNPSATSEMQTAGTFADASTGLFIAGGALLATGVVLVLTGSPRKQTTGLWWSPSWLAHGGGLALTGSW